MSNTIGSFSAVYFTLAAILFILVLFEKHFIQLEDKIRANRTKAKKSVKNVNSKKTAHKSKQASVRKANVKNTASLRKAPNNAA